jgi:hypothetical protein
MVSAAGGGGGGATFPVFRYPRSFVRSFVHHIMSYHTTFESEYGDKSTLPY